MGGAFRFGKIAALAGKSLIEDLIAEVPVEVAMKRKFIIPHTRVVGMGHSSKWRYADGETSAMAACTVKELADVCLGGISLQLREGVEILLHRAVFSAKPRSIDCLQMCVLGGKLGTKAHGKVASSTCFGPRTLPRA